jgi:hypothetical protein
MSSNEEINITLNEKDFKSDVEAAMLMLSDGLTWRLTSDPEDTGESLVMSSPEDIAEFLTLYLFHPESRDTDLLGSEDPAASAAPA